MRVNRRQIFRIMAYPHYIGIEARRTRPRRDDILRRHAHRAYASDSVEREA